MKLSGHCLCGAVRFTVDGWVSPVQACHAQRCRRATGALYTPEIAVQMDGFRWLGDVDAITRYEAPLQHQPPAYRRNFCNRCGSPLPVEAEGYMIVHAGILDDTRALHIFRHAFTGQKSDLIDVPVDAEQFAGQPPTPDPSRILP